MVNDSGTIKSITFQKHWIHLFLGALAVLGLFYLAENNFLLFHSLAELFSIVIAGCIFIVAWNARRFLDNHFFLFLGLAFLFIGALETFHTLSYRGMGVFPGDDANLPTQLWIAARYFESISLLIAPIFISRTLNTRSAFIFFSAVFLLLLGSIFRWDIFPDCYVEGKGLTLFKILSEYCISLLLLLAAIFLYRRKDELDESTLQLMLAAIFLAIGAELAFTFYVSVFGLSNLIGHILKFLSVFLVYKALIESGLKKPYDLLFRKTSQSEALYRNFYNTAPLAIVVWDCDCRITDWNRHAELIFGWTSHEVLGRNFFEVLMPEGAGPQSDKIVEVLSSGIFPRCSINENLTKSGKIILCEWNNSILYNDKNQVIGVISLALDITQRRQAEEGLRESEKKHRLLLNNLQVGIVVHAADTRILMNNPMAGELLGLTDDPMQGKVAIDPAWRFCREDGTPMPPEEYPVNQVITSENVLKNQILGIHRPAAKDYVWVLCWAYPVFDPQNRLQQVVTHFINITEQKEAVKRLQEEREKFRLIFENVTDVIVYVDKFGRILEVNNKIEELVGYRSDEIIGRQFMKLGLFKLKQAPKLFKIFKDAVMGGDVLDTTGKGFNRMELEVHDKSGDTVAVEVSTTSVKKDGKLQGFLSIIHDISERKRAEQVLQEAHDVLEKRVEERTAELQLAHNQLLHTEKLGAIGNLSASIAHEFNNPLFGIRNVLRGIKQRTSLDEDDTELVDMALQECDRIKFLIQDLQDFNRPTSGVMAPMDVHKAIDGILLLFKNEFQQQKITVEKHYAPNLPKIQAVADQIKQVVLNLLKNGADAIPEKGGTITITTEALEGNKVAIHVRDSGQGIKPEDVDHIFEPFFSTKSNVKGTGLGLSVSYGIIKGHQGKIGIHSEAGKGTAFSIILPVESEDSGLRTEDLGSEE